VGILLVLELVVLAAVEGWVQTPNLESPSWVRDSAIAQAIATHTPTPTPTPTMAPRELAAQFAPQLQTALDSANWDRALELIDIMQAVDPQGDEVRAWAVRTHTLYGQALVDAAQVDLAQMQFDQAVSLEPEDEEASLWQGTTQLYRTGRVAFDLGQWNGAISSFLEAYDNIPTYGDLFTRLVDSYRRKGEAAIEAQEWSVAIESLLESYERTPNDPEILNLLSQAYQGYGYAILEEGDWSVAIEQMATALDYLPDDQDILDLMAVGYRERGIAYQEAIKLKQAREDLKQALAVLPGDERAEKHLGQVEYVLSKKIEIDISRQRLYAWKGNQLVYNFVVSTGLRGRDTASGHFYVQNKIPMAYSRVWRLKMPYWLGIYWVQGIENGIHALPIRPDGSVMWAGLLGQRASYGCVILNNSAAKKLYNWADLGTPVHIHY
jgi:tetratricopeptide (TPR) repeat protein